MVMRQLTSRWFLSYYIINSVHCIIHSDPCIIHMPFPDCSKKQREETGSIISSRGREGPGIIPLSKSIINDEEVIHPKESQSRRRK